MYFDTHLSVSALRGTGRCVLARRSRCPWAQFLGGIQECWKVHWHTTFRAISLSLNNPKTTEKGKSGGMLAQSHLQSSSPRVMPNWHHGGKKEQPNQKKWAFPSEIWVCCRDWSQKDEKVVLHYCALKNLHFHEIKGMLCRSIQICSKDRKQKVGLTDQFSEWRDDSSRVSKESVLKPVILNW